MYLLSWSPRYYETGKTELAEIGKFINDRSYSRKDLIRIAAMEIGDTIKLDEGHHVTKIN